VTFHVLTRAYTSCFTANPVSFFHFDSRISNEQDLVGLQGIWHSINLNVWILYGFWLHRSMRILDRVFLVSLIVERVQIPISWLDFEWNIDDPCRLIDWLIDWLIWFRLRHYAGWVNYNVAGFVEKNQDLLFRGLSQAMFRCSQPILKELFPEGNPRRNNIRRSTTSATQFKVWYSFHRQMNNKSRTRANKTQQNKRNTFILRPLWFHRVFPSLQYVRWISFFFFSFCFLFHLFFMLSWEVNSDDDR